MPKPNQVVVDFETRSTVDLTATGAIVYAQHESSSIFCLGYKIDNEPARLWIPERSPMPDDLWEAFQHAVLIAHNASFERAITRWLLSRYETLTPEQQAYLPTIPPRRWKCTAAKAAASSLPRSLEMACLVLELPIQKDMEGGRLIKKYSQPRKPSKYNPKVWWDDKKELRHIYRYCLIDIEAEYGLDRALPDLIASEQKIWELDQVVNDRGVLLDIPTIKIILKMIEEELGQVTERVRALSAGSIQEPTQRAKILKWVNQRGAHMENLQAPTIAEKLLEDGLGGDIRAMLEYRQHASKTSTAKYLAMIKAVGLDNRARELLLFLGAFVTGRWSGKRIQPQNMVRGHLKYEDVLRAIDIIKGAGA